MWMEPPDWYPSKDRRISSAFGNTIFIVGETDFLPMFSLDGGVVVPSIEKKESTQCTGNVAMDETWAVMFGGLLVTLILLDSYYTDQNKQRAVRAPTGECTNRYVSWHILKNVLQTKPTPPRTVWIDRILPQPARYTSNKRSFDCRKIIFLQIFSKRFSPSLVSTEVAKKVYLEFLAASE